MSVVGGSHMLISRWSCHHTHTHTPFLRKNRSPSLYPWWNSSSSWLQDVGHNAFVRRTIFFALICSGWSEMLTMCGEADSPWGQMSQSPLNGDTEMTSGSELKGMLLVKPPSQHRCRKEGREGVNLTYHVNISWDMVWFTNICLRKVIV